MCNGKMEVGVIAWKFCQVGAKLSNGNSPATLVLCRYF